MSLSKGVYWCARDLAVPLPVGNHHFLLLIADQSDFQYMGLNPHNENGILFYTFGATTDSSFRLVPSYDNADDVKSVREFIDPDEHTAWYKPDFDLEPNKVSSDINMIRRVALRSDYYKKWQKKDSSKLPYYKGIEDNCASWVNSMLASLGVSKADRERLGDKVGFDFGEGTEIDLTLFTNPN